MPLFSPFSGLRYDTEKVDIAKVVAPPYDVIDTERRNQLADLDPHNVVHIDVPYTSGDADPYVEAAKLFASWQESGVLVRDEPSFYVYEMAFISDLGEEATTVGVIGALQLPDGDRRDVLPHEHTTKKAKSDRLRLMEACSATISPIWCLSMADGLTDAVDRADTAPDAEWIASDSTRHRLWHLTDAATIERITQLVATTPVLIADGHHRFETAMTYRDQRRAAGEAQEEADFVMALVVELSTDNLFVRGIPRLISGVAADALIDYLSAMFTVEQFDGTPSAQLLDTMAERESLAIYSERGTALLTPKPEAFDPLPRLDTERLDQALVGLAGAEVVYQHGVENVVKAVDGGDATAAVFVRPPSVEQIRASSEAEYRMPPKSTFFHPKPSTGMVFRTIC